MLKADLSVVNVKVRQIEEQPLYLCHLTSTGMPCSLVEFIEPG